MNKAQELAKAKRIAEEYHSTQKRENGELYILHLERVVCNLTSEEEKIIGWLHDSLEDTSLIWDKLVETLEPYYIKYIGVDNRSSNIIGGKFVDYDEFYFKDKNAYKKDLYDRYTKTVYWGNPGSAYQDIPSIGINGCRSYKRFDLLGMTDLDLSGKTVLDIGCSGGQVLFWASEINADRIVGVDLPEIANVTFEMANYHEKFNIETVGCDLTRDDVQDLIYKKTGIKEFDYVVMFSINYHVGFHQYMKDLCKDTLFLECNAAKMEDIERKEYPEELRKLGYKEFEYRGQVNESGGRSLFICR